MKRRRFLAGAGAFAATGSLTLGTGAFTSVSTERSVSIAVADDDRAYLRLEPIEDVGRDDNPTGRSSTSGSEVTFDIPGYDDGENKNAGGVAPDSVYKFDDLLQIVNQGTQPVTVRSSYSGRNFEELALFTSAGRLSKAAPTLGVGDSVNVGLYIDTHGTEVGTYDEMISITAERVGGNRD